MSITYCPCSRARLATMAAMATAPVQYSISMVRSRTSHQLIVIDLSAPSFTHASATVLLSPSIADSHKSQLNSKSFCSLLGHPGPAQPNVLSLNCSVTVIRLCFFEQIIIFHAVTCFSVRRRNDTFFVSSLPYMVVSFKVCEATLTRTYLSRRSLVQTLRRAAIAKECLYFRRSF
jgi:hypothetical protein